MIRGHVAVVKSDSPLPNIAELIVSCKRTIIKLFVSKPLTPKEKFQVFMSVKGLGYYIRVLENIRKIDRFENRLVRISFIRPNVDIVIVGTCKPGEFESFVGVVKNFILWCSHRSVIALSSTAFCSVCYDRRSGGDSAVGRNTVATSQLQIAPIAVNSYTYLMTITISKIGILDIPEEFGLLPCLNTLFLSDNRLGEAPSTRWNWLTSPFMKENLLKLYLDNNRITKLPETITGLRNLEYLSLNNNCLSELPDTLGNLKQLRYLFLVQNKLTILPASLYRKQLFINLLMNKNYLGINKNCFNILKELAPYKFELLRPENFETVAVPSLFDIATRFIIDNGIDFMEYNLPQLLENYLKGVHYCYCGSLVSCNTKYQEIHCLIVSSILAFQSDCSYFLINIRCCSHSCYKLIEPYILAGSLKL